MPYKARRGCAYQGCKELAEKNETYCKKHLYLSNKQYDKFGRQYNHSERYGGKWTKLRNRYLSEHPLCEECLLENKSTLATIVHHKIPIEDGGAILDVNNLESVCPHHHQILHKSKETI